MTKYIYRKGPYVYFRGRDGKLTPLPAEDSPGFNTAYEACLAERDSRPHDRRPRELGDVGRSGKVAWGPGTVGRFIGEYMRSDRFRNFADGTRYNYGKAFDLMLARIGPAILADLDEERVEIYTAQIARQHGGSCADQQRHLLSTLWDHAKGYSEFQRAGRSNPTLGAKKHYRVKHATQAWPEEVQEAFLETAKGPLVLAYYVLRFSAQRGCDAIRIKWSDIRADGSIRLVQRKTGTPVWHKLPAPLMHRLAETPRISEYVLTNNWRRPWRNATTLSHAIRNHFDKLGLPRFKMHGLRATAACELGSINAGTEGIRAVTGHLSDRMARQYAAEFDQKRVNADVVDRWNVELERKEAARAARRRAKLKVV